jgi:phosphohistidine phosphatase SixA
MGRIRLIAVAVGLVMSQPAASAFAQDGIPALIVLVRHGDTSPDVPGDRPLNALGLKRANDLAAALNDMKPTAIIATPFRRTQETAKPVASAFKLALEIIPYRGAMLESHVKEVAAAVRRHSGGSVLVVGHTNSLPPLVRALGGPQIKAICETTFDNLFMMVPAASGARFVQARYGAASPISTKQDCL